MAMRYWVSLMENKHGEDGTEGDYGDMETRGYIVALIRRRIGERRR